ncbi:hypothetical protein P3S67_024064 [Capsicum chacoense]
MLDLSNLNKIEIDWKEETVWVQAGATLGQLYYAIANKSNVHGFPGGICFSVGTGGLISGGGLGTMMRKFGLGADNVVDARVMEVNGIILDKKTMRKDLFWTIREGGGASFGVILAWKLKLVRVPEKVTVFSVGKKLEGQKNSLNLIWRKKIASKSLLLIVVTGLALKKYRETTWIESVLYFYGKRTNESLEVLLDKSIPTQKIHNKGTSDFVKTPTPKSGWKMVQRLFLEEERPQMILEPLGGKLDELSEFEIPFPHRTGNLYNIQYLINWGDNSENVSSQKLAWMRKLYKDMEPYAANSPRTAYLNYRDLDFGSNDEDYSYSKAKIWGEMYFNGNFERLAKVKSKVDPNNIFRTEQSIPPY